MKVLIVDEEVPWPLNTGKRLRTYNLVQRLQKKHSITYLCYGISGSVLPNCPNVQLIALPSPILEQKGIRFYGSLFANLFSSKPYIVSRHYSQLMADKASSLLAAGQFDLVHCEWMPYTENIRTLLGKSRSVLSAHNVEARIWERYFQVETNFFKKAYVFIQWRKLDAYETQVAPKYTSVLTVSETDRDFFITKYKCKYVKVIPNGVDEQFFFPEQRDPEPGSMVFTGSMDWRPNQDGVRHFVEAIFPLIKRRIPHATFTVVGRRPPLWLVSLAKQIEGVTVTGTVDDVRPYVASSMLYVVPLRIGGGSRLKILEALSMEKTVLSTTIGAEGLDVEEGKHVLLRDTPEDFADAACDILNNPSAFVQFASAGRALILKSYTWDAIAKIMSEVWENAGA